LTGYIYLITNTVNGKKYIGATKISVSTRWSQHRSSAKRGSQYALHQAIHKYGKEAFSVKTLETVVGTYAELMAAEIRAISVHATISPAGYNLTSGGEGIDFSVPEVRERHAEGIRKREGNSGNHLALMEGIRKRSCDPNWKIAHAEGTRKMLLNPKWKETCALAGLNRAASPEWRKSNIEAMRKRFADPAQRLAVGETNRRTVTKPEWQKANAEALKGVRAKGAAKILERDGQLDPKELTRKLQQREYARRHRAKKLKAVL